VSSVCTSLAIGSSSISKAILDAHYLGRDVQLAEAAVLKLEARTKL
jgi:hypothetical protein